MLYTVCVYKEKLNLNPQAKDTNIYLTCVFSVHNIVPWIWCVVYLRIAVHWKICRLMQVPVLKSSCTQNQIWLWRLLWTTQRWVQSLKLWGALKSQRLEKQNSSYLSYFLRFWKMLLSDLTPKYCVFQHIQVNFAAVIFAEHLHLSS